MVAASDDEHKHKPSTSQDMQTAQAAVITGAGRSSSGTATGSGGVRASDGGNRETKKESDWVEGPQ